MIGRYVVGRWLIILTLGLLQASSASAEIFRWVDEAGKLHFVQSLQQVPARYRSQVLQPSPAKSAGHFQTYTSPVNPNTASAARDIRIPFESDGNLMRVTALVNDHTNIPFLIDTGASGVSIPEEFAHELGITVDEDTPRITITTANGELSVPLVRLHSIVLGSARVENLTATLNPTLDVGLLGGSFFNNFSYQVDPNTSIMTLKPNYTAVPNMGEGYWRSRFEEVNGPLAELEKYLEENEGTLHWGRRDELEGKHEELLAKLEELELEATRNNVPPTWRY
jgi:clan AA aspartic protease (TIGR02281 family)